jgi:hypothetical protein
MKQRGVRLRRKTFYQSLDRLTPGQVEWLLRCVYLEEIRLQQRAERVWTFPDLDAAPKLIE